MLFGTDGVRDLATTLLNDNIAYSVGRATASLKNQPIIAVAFDTRESGRVIERQFIEGATAAGARIIECGLLPTPALAYITYLAGADYGVMISASHNPPEYNGIKIFTGEGNKLSLAEEEEIEEIIKCERYVSGFGYESDGTSYRKDYIDRIVRLAGANFKGLKITLDCCFGATAKIAPRIFQKLGAEVTALCNSYNGRLVNVYSGATNIDYLKNNTSGDIGFSFDGDGDRVLGVSADQRIIDGDCMLYFLAKDMLQKNALTPKIVVGTKMTNMALCENLENRGVEVVRAAVGDKYVLELMKKTGAVLGGEQAGHIIVKNEISTGDGILAAVLITKLYSQGINLSEFVPYPQIQRNYKAKREILENPTLQAEIKAVEEKICGNGRILIRPSGTEPLIRLLVEGKNSGIVRDIFIQLDNIIKKYC